MVKIFTTWKLDSSLRVTRKEDMQWYIRRDQNPTIQKHLANQMAFPTRSRKVLDTQTDTAWALGCLRNWSELCIICMTGLLGVQVEFRLMRGPLRELLFYESRKLGRGLLMVKRLDHPWQPERGEGEKWELECGWWSLGTWRRHGQVR